MGSVLFFAFLFFLSLSFCFEKSGNVFVDFMVVGMTVFGVLGCLLSFNLAGRCQETKLFATRLRVGKGIWLNRTCLPNMAMNVQQVAASNVVGGHESSGVRSGRYV